MDVTPACVVYCKVTFRNYPNVQENNVMPDTAEERVSRFYSTVGWETDGEITEDARRWEDSREHAKEYVSKCRLRVLRHMPANGVNILDMASGPIQYKEYLEYSKNFRKRYCVDLSSAALEQARKRIGDHGVFLHGSFFDIPLEENFFDCAVSLHTIYHIDKDRQEEAVRKLIRVTKSGKPVVIVYSNPDTIVSHVKSSLPFQLLRRARSVFTWPRKEAMQAEGLSPNFHSHPVKWWDRFEDVATVRVFPWRSFDSDTQKGLIPDNRMGRKLLDVLFKLEDRFPEVFVEHFQYPLIVLTKRVNRAPVAVSE